MSSLPTGTVTFLFTDIEGSTRRWEESPAAMQAAFSRQEAILRHAVEANGGYAYKMIGDAFQAAFPTAPQALQATIDAQRALSSESWPSQTGDVTVRMALHTGITEERGDDYVGPLLNRVARLLSAGHGGQILLSEVTTGLVRDTLPPGVTLLDMGEHRLKDLTRPEHVFQLVVPDLPSEFPPLKTLDNRPNNLPVQPTPLVGREKELAEVEKLLRREDVRLVTLTGPGGTGKTRLGLQVASDLLEGFAEGVWFVDLSSLKDPALVVPTIGAVLGLKETAGQSLVDTLKAYLKNRHNLLVLDNLEQVAEAAPQLSQLLASSVHLKVLATSRVPLTIRGEKQYPVPPLGLPDVNALPPLEHLARYEAVRLFTERATDVRPDFQLTHENVKAVAQICARLDGLPLAIELAAARVRMLPPDALLSRLSQRLSLLTGGAKDLPARQQTLHNTIEWSYDLLEEGEKQLFRRMAPFSGGRSLEALEAVCNYDGLLEIDVFEGTESLLSKSLLRQVDGKGGEPRFQMLETIHEYAREKLAEGREGNGAERKALERQHALYFMRLAEEAEPRLTGGEGGEWLDRLEDEYANIRAALLWARETESGKVRKIETELPEEGREADSVEIGLRIAGAIGHFWRVRGNYSEGREQLSGLLELDKATGPGARDSMASRAKASRWVGVLARLQGDYASARSMFEQDLAIRRELGDTWGIAGSLNNLGNVALEQGDYASARSLFEQDLAVCKELGDKRGIAVAVNNLGIVAQQQGDFASARPLYEESLAIRRELEDKRGIAFSLNNLGVIALEQGDYASARSLSRESLSIQRELGNKWGIASSLNNLGIIALEEEDYASARPLYEESLAMCYELGDKLGIASALAGLGSVEVSTRIAGEVSASATGTTGSNGAGETAARRTNATNRLRRAVRLLGAVEALLTSMGAVLAAEDRRPYERGIAQARAGLREADFEQAMQEGRAMSMEEAFEYALEEN